MTKDIVRSLLVAITIIEAALSIRWLLASAAPVPWAMSAGVAGLLLLMLREAWRARRRDAAWAEDAMLGAAFGVSGVVLILAWAVLNLSQRLTDCTP